MALKRGSTTFVAMAFGSLAWAAGAGCSGRSMSGAVLECSSDSDCAAGEVCIERDPARRPNLLVPCRWQYCSDTVTCPSPLVCAPSPPFGSHEACGAASCLESCSVMGCQPDEICRDDGICELVSCDAPDATPCPEHWQCDPSRSSSESATIAGSSVGDASDPARAIRRGCVRLRCDESDGYVCLDTFECALDRASETTGCAPAPCSETGHCPNESTQVCGATSPYPPPAPPDAFGCVPKHCEQGYECRYEVSIGYLPAIANILSCNPTHPEADSYGCGPVTCEDEPTWCEPGRSVCDPTHPQKNLLGCRYVSNSSGGGTSSGGTSSGGTSGQGGAGGTEAGASSGGNGASGRTGRCAPAGSD